MGLECSGSGSGIVVVVLEADAVMWWGGQNRWWGELYL